MWSSRRNMKRRRMSTVTSVDNSWGDTFCRLVTTCWESNRAYPRMAFLRSQLRKRWDEPPMRRWIASTVLRDLCLPESLSLTASPPPLRGLPPPPRQRLSSHVEYLQLFVNFIFLTFCYRQLENSSTSSTSPAPFLKSSSNGCCFWILLFLPLVIANLAR